jgi:hypothetical protein
MWWRGRGEGAVGPVPRLSAPGQTALPAARRRTKASPRSTQKALETGGTTLGRQPVGHAGGPG